MTEEDKIKAIEEALETIMHLKQRLNRPKSFTPTDYSKNIVTLKYNILKHTGYMVVLIKLLDDYGFATLISEFEFEYKSGLKCYKTLKENVKSKSVDFDPNFILTITNKAVLAKMEHKKNLESINNGFFMFGTGIVGDIITKEINIEDILSNKENMKNLIKDIKLLRDGKEIS